VVSWWKGETGHHVPTDETIVVSMCAGVMLAFVIAVINKVTRLGLLSRMAERVTFVLIPPLLLIFLVLGTIFLGIATPTEGGAMGALGALIMAIARGRLSFSLLKQALNTTTKLSCFVVFILIGSTCSAWLPGRGRPALGGAPADRPAGRPARLPDRGQHPDLLPGLLPGLLRAVLHRGAAAGARWPRSWAST
jgi:hypothetical protein